MLTDGAGSGRGALAAGEGAAAGMGGGAIGATGAGVGGGGGGVVYLWRGWSRRRARRCATGAGAPQCEQNLTPSARR